MIDFSRFYDAFQEDVDYKSLLEPIIPYLNKNEILLDAGCGSGHILKYLSSLGYKVLGIDNDEKMLSLAQEKIEENSLDASVFYHDLRNPMNHKFSQIICLLDVFHYFKGVKRLVKNLYTSLDKGGILILDLYTHPVNENEADTFLNLNYMWQTKTVNHQIDHYIELSDQNNTYSYHIKQYYQPLDYYISVLINQGFKVESISGFDDRKTYLICIK
ncbi:class I SAM-dependent DNA methyltransferase [Acholeplasma granularum]|uniref:class I SAM-dependent DNA methyltransferase n=1 Tax=Acholeplasma granularum TaxID=264635 RepID=UPI000472244D|nr:class I SAM-dependent methyltransferase [Acholeplasma granularum]